MKLVVSTTIDRPVGNVFTFFADEQVRNHPRWDPEMELEAVTPGPIRVGSVIRRRASRGGNVVEGTMEVVEFERDRVFGTHVRDGPSEVRGRATFQASGPRQTVLTLDVDIPALDDPEKAAFVTRMIERSLGNIKHLVESDTSPT